MTETPKRPWWKRVLRGVVVYAVTPLVLFLLLMLIFEDSLIYHPSRPPEGDWTLEPWIEDVTLTASDGTRLHGWFCKGEEAKWTILFCHGNAGNLTHRRDFMKQLVALPADVLIIDWRGYGKSEGSPSEAGLYLDVRAAYDYLTQTRGVPAEQIVIYGVSLGAAPAIELATQVPCGRMIIQSAFCSIPEMSKQVIPLIPVGWMVRTKYDNLSKAPKLTMPTLHIHSVDDEVIPFDQGRRVFEAAPDPKTFYEVPKGGHNNLIWSEGRRFDEHLRAFLDLVPPAS